jgi:membrane-associated phospholipid phosphatase
MDSIFQLGIAFAVWFQGLGSWLTVPMKFFTFLGSEEFFLLFLPVIYWCVDAGLGLRLGAMLLFNSGVNDFFKLAMHGPRPYWFSTQVQALSSETSFGVPSGHAQMAVGLWGVLAAYTRRGWAWAVAVFVMLMIGLSRLYLGVHFLHDVLLGWVIGALVLWAFLSLWDKVLAWSETRPLGQQILLAFSLSALILAAGAGAFTALRDWQLPAGWIANARAAGAEDPAPVTYGGVIVSAATLFGLLAGLAWLRTQGGFSAGGPLGQRVARFLLGLIGIGLLWYGLGLLFPRGETLLPYLLRYLRYALVGGWISAGGPWLFLRLGLAQKPA